MKNITLDDLLNNIALYDLAGVEKVKYAYDFASYLHEGQYRESGEEYISHPLNVAYILSLMHADIDTICAGLLHDTLEDTKVTKEEIASYFNPDVALLVDGVTKISKLNFSSKSEQNMANTRKIIVSLTSDVRIIIIKLADRLHNMRTLEYKNTYKQKENSMETMDIFVPLAYYIGAYRIKSELEDLSLKYLYADKYVRINEIRQSLISENNNALDEMRNNIEEKLIENNIENDIKIRIKNIYGIFKELSKGHIIADIHDLFAIKIMVDSITNCYQTLGIVHSLYNPINDKFKDFIYNPKTNMYRSIHTTVFGNDDKLVQTQIRTFDMDKIADFGLTAYWDINKGDARVKMQEDLKNKYQFFKSLVEINSVFADNKEFVNQVKNELLSDKIYVYNGINGEIIELPKGSSTIDFAYKLGTDTGNTMAYAIVNERRVEPGYILNNKDRVRIVTDELAYGYKEDWLTNAYTTKARTKIKEFNNR